MFVTNMRILVHNVLLRGSGTDFPKDKETDSMPLTKEGSGKILDGGSPKNVQGKRTKDRGMRNRSVDRDGPESV